MANYGVTSAGFVLKRLETIANEMRANAQAQLPEIDASVDAVPGTIIDVVSEAIAEQWQLAEQDYNARYPSTAQGGQLDRIGQINAIGRLDQRKSTVELGFEGTNGTIIAAGKQVKSDNGDFYQVLLEEALDNTGTNRVEVQAITIIAEHTYTIIIDSNSVDYISDLSPTIVEITEGIVAAINAQTTTLLVNAIELDVDTGKFYITSNDGIRAFEVTLNSDFQLNKFWTPIKIAASEFGPLEAGAGTITTIVTPVAGLNSVNNFTDVTVGDFNQSDDDYRLRLFQEPRRLGGGSLEAIKARILNEVEDVIAVKAFENHTIDDPDIHGRPTKSIEILVEGGADVDIAEELWKVKGGGIETYGTDFEDITDSQESIRRIYFSRPVPIYIWLKITITTDPSEYPLDGDTKIKENVVLKGRETFGIGDDIIIQQFYCPIYEVPGVETALIEVQKTSDLTPPVSYVTTNLTIDDDEVPLFDTTRVQVITS